MRLLIIALLLPFFSQAQYAQFQTGKEKDVKSYEVQYSNDQLSWTSIDTLQPQGADTNTYVATLPLTSIYVRVKANMTVSAYFTQVLYLNRKPEIIIIPNPFATKLN